MKTISMVLASPPPADPSAHFLEAKPRSFWRDVWHRLRRNRGAVICLWIIVAYGATGLIACLPVFNRYPPADSLAKLTEAQRQQELGLIWRNVGGTYQPPRWGWPNVWFGTDIQGRSVFYHVFYGTRIALAIAIGASILTIVIGFVLGIISGYFGGWVDSIVIWLFSTVYNVPWILLTIALTFIIRNSQKESEYWSDLYTIILALGLTSWVGLCRLVRGEVLSLRERDYVMAARAAGAGTIRILTRHILPNVAHLIIITFTLSLVDFVQAEVVLSFLGLGINSSPSWGRMIDDAKLELLRGVWWQFGIATIAVFVLCLAVNVFGDALRDALDPRLRGVN